MIILGIDPGTATTGWGVVQHKKAGNKRKPDGSFFSLIGFGCITTKPDKDMPLRLLELKRALKKIIKSYKPDSLVVERIFFGQNSSSAITVGQARGVIMLVAAEENLRLFEYTGLEVKSTISAYGRATKKQVQIGVRRILKVRSLPKPKDQLGKPVWQFRDDAYDAAAAAIHHIISIGNKSSR